MASRSVLNSLLYENIRLLLIKYVKMKKKEVEKKKENEELKMQRHDLPGK